jgi:hypothetical protein
MRSLKQNWRLFKERRWNEKRDFRKLSRDILLITQTTMIWTLEKFLEFLRSQKMIYSKGKKKKRNLL